MAHTQGLHAAAVANDCERARSVITVARESVRLTEFREDLSPSLFSLALRPQGTLATAINSTSGSKTGQAPIHIAVERQYADFVDLLLVNGADVEATDQYGDTALLRAVEVGSIQMINKLLDHGADIEV